MRDLASRLFLPRVAPERIFSSFQVMLGAESGLKVWKNFWATEEDHSHLEPTDLRGKEEAVVVTGPREPSLIKAGKHASPVVI